MQFRELELKKKKKGGGGHYFKKNFTFWAGKILLS